MKKSVIFSNALAKANEIRLLKKEQLIRLSNASNFEEALKMLYDYGYARVDGEDLDDVIQVQMDNLFAFIYDNSPSPHLTTLLINPYLYNNAKLYYKSRFSKIPDALYNLDDQHIRQGIQQKEYSLLPSAMRQCAEELDKLFLEKEPDGKSIDKKFNSAMFKDNLSAAKKSGNKALRHYVISEIDLNNFVSFLRCRRLNRAWEYCQSMLYVGGNIQISLFSQLYDKSHELLLQEFGQNKYPDVFEDILSDRINLDLSIDSVLADFAILDLMEYTSLSPFLHYAKRQTIEYRIVRMILTCIKNDAREQIDSRIRGLYE